MSILGVSATDNMNDTLVDETVNLESHFSSNDISGNSNENKTFDQLCDEVDNSTPGDTIIINHDYYCFKTNRSDGINVLNDNITIDGKGYKFNGNQ